MHRRPLHFIAFLITVSVSPCAAAPIVNELMAVNRATLADPEGEFDDWVEIYNPDSTDLDLRGYFVSDEVDDPSKWVITGEAPVVVPAEGYALLWLDNDPEAGANHLPFRLRAEGESFILTAPDGTTVLDQVELPQQHADISYGRSQEDGGQFRYLINPTPGEANNPLGVALLESVAFSREPGAFVEPFQLTLTTTSAEVIIRYTLDRTVPTDTNGELYDSPVTIDQSSCVRAALFLGSRQISPVETRIFLALDESLAGFDSNLPIVLLDSQGYDFSRDSDPARDYPIRPVCAGIFDLTESGRAAVADQPHYIGRAGMNVRGASSKGWPKKQFKFETWDEEDADRDVPLLGMPADSDWILNAPYFDRSLMRNQFIYHFWGQLGYYTPGTRYVEVFLNPDSSQPFTMEHYQGVYVLTEKIKRSPDRMDVTRLKADDLSEPEITGGYVAQATNLNQDWTSRRGIRLKYVEPLEKDGLGEQLKWLRDYFAAAEASVYSSDYKDPITGYASFLDVPSHIDYDIMRELSRNIDGASTFFSIERGGKLKMGPLWDYNQALGLTSLGSGWKTDGWNNFYMGNSHWMGWWGKMDNDSNYQMAWNDRWVELRESLLSTDQLIGHINAVAALLEEAQVRNFEKWDTLGKAVWVTNNRTRADPGESERDTYAKEVDFLRSWIGERLQWIDAQVPSPPDFSQNGGSVAAGFSLELSEGMGFEPYSGEIRYTLDGTDPASAGAVSFVYSEPLVLNESAHILARTKKGEDDWSALREATFIVGAQPATSAALTLSEIHYNPEGSDELEFVELANRGTSNIDLTGVRLSNAVEFEFGELELAPGGTVGVVENEEAFKAVFAEEGGAHYVEEIVIAGQWTGRLNNAGETIELLNPAGEVIHRVSYRQDGDWPGEADGKGFTLELNELDSDPAEAANWRLSSFENGTPGWVRSADAGTAEEWQQRQFSAAELAQPEVSDLSSDPDNDGLSNLLEFALNTLPLKADAGTSLRSEIETINVSGVSQDYLTVTFDRPAKSELHYLLQISSDLSDWLNSPMIRVRSSTNPDSQIETLSIRAKQPISETGQSGQSYLRMRVIR